MIIDAAANKQLYTAYQSLQIVAQGCDSSFKPPCYLIVGHQSDGKSALVEGLMGFQFTDVGGGTKTRRPLTVQMTFDADAKQPDCYLYSDDGVEHSIQLELLQAHIEKDNADLALRGVFEEKEMIVKIQYCGCPCLTITDMPGLISSLDTSAGAGQAASAQVKSMVLAKMKETKYIIVCLEDRADWANATTRHLVVQADPTLSRTVLVSTKFDTRINTFSSADDCNSFLNPGTQQGVSEALLGGPFFTSMRGGRVGPAPSASVPSGPGFEYGSDEDFCKAIWKQEEVDIENVEKKMRRPLTEVEQARMGVSKLRLFLEDLLRHRYLQAVPVIVPLLESATRDAEAKMSQIEVELGMLDPTSLKATGRKHMEALLDKLKLIMSGSAMVPIDVFGQTLAEEHRDGADFKLDGITLLAPAAVNTGMRLFGGAQYHRSMAEFRSAVGSIPCPVFSAAEIANACGLGIAHDGPDYIRAACTIVVAKAHTMFQPFIYQLGKKVGHVLQRLHPIAMHLLEADAGVGSSLQSSNGTLFQQFRSVFFKFIDESKTACEHRVEEDLLSSTGFVTFSMHDKNGSSVKAMAHQMRAVPAENSPARSAPPTPPSSTTGSMTATHHSATSGQPISPEGLLDTLFFSRCDMSQPILPVAPPSLSRMNSTAGRATPASVKADSPPVSPPAASVGAFEEDLLETMFFSRSLNSTNKGMTQALVQELFNNIRNHIVQQAELKFNQFFLMQLVNHFPTCLRDQMEIAFQNIERIMDKEAIKEQLEQRKLTEGAQLDKVKALQETFNQIQRTLSLA